MNTLIEKIKELKELMQKEFPEGGVSITIIGDSSPKKSQINNNVPPVPPIDTDSLDMDKIKTLLNGYAKQHGVEAAYTLVEKLTGGSKSPADIPKDKYSYLVQACIVEGCNERS